MASDIVMFQDVKVELGELVEKALRAALQSGSADVSRCIVKDELSEVVEEAMNLVLQRDPASGDSISGRICQDVKSQLQEALEEMLPRAMRAETAEISASISERVCNDVRQEIQSFSRSASKRDDTSASPTSVDTKAVQRRIGEKHAQLKRSAADGASRVSGSPVVEDPRLTSNTDPRLSSSTDYTPVVAVSSEPIVELTPVMPSPSVKGQTFSAFGEPPSRKQRDSSSRERPSRNQMDSDFGERKTRGSNVSDISYATLIMDEDDLDIKDCIEAMHGLQHGSYLLGRVRSDRPAVEGDESNPEARAWASQRVRSSAVVQKKSFMQAAVNKVKSVAFRDRQQVSAPSPDLPADLANTREWSDEKGIPVVRNVTSFHGLLPQGTRAKVNIRVRASIAGNAMMSVGKKRTHELVSSRHFEIAIAVILLLNALFIGVQVDFMARNSSEKTLPTAFKVIGWIFCALFVVELLMRLFVYGWRFFCVPEWKWNVFDLIVVSLQVAEELTDVVVDSLLGKESNHEYTNFTAVRVLRVLRLVRVVRFMRILRLIRELHTMVGSIIGSLRSFLWTMSLLLMMIFIGGVYITQLVVDYSRSYPEEYGGSPEVQQYWGSLGSSILSLFQALSGGVDWDVLLASLQKATQYALPMAILFAGYIAFAMFVMLNLVTGIFVDSAQTNVREDRDLDLVNRVRELFLTTDDDHSGCITWQEFQTQLRNPQMEEYFKVIDLDMSEAQNLFNLLDIRGVGSITAEEFVNGALRLRGAARAFDFMVHIHHSKRIYLRLLAGIKGIEQHLGLVAQELNIELPAMAVSSLRTSKNHKLFSKKYTGSLAVLPTADTPSI